MPVYQNSTVTDSKIEVGNYQIWVGAQNTTAGGTWVNLGAGMLKSMTYTPEMFTSQAGNAVDPIQGVARETATIDIDLIEYDGSSFSSLSGDMLDYTGGTLIVGGSVTTITGKGLKLINTRKLATGSTQTTTYVILNAYLNNGYTFTPKSDNDADPVGVYSFQMLCKQYATAGNIFTKAVT